MIKVDKGSAPVKWNTRAQAARKELEDNYDKGQTSFKFKKSIYGPTSIKNKLLAAQHFKCCFCERKNESGDVEHYRPKGGYQQDESDTLNQPGYYWKAYDWDNLFFSCAKCNQTYKKNFFPLATPTTRCTNHHGNLNTEDPLIIHPENEDPEAYIEYIGAAPRAIGGNLKGRLTIERTGLDRPFLDERREAHYRNYKKIYSIYTQVALPKEEKESIKLMLIDAQKDEAEFASMIRSALKHGFIY